MGKRSWIIAAAVGIALLLLLLTLLGGGSDSIETHQPERPVLTGPTPLGFDPDRTIESLRPGMELAENVEGYRIERLNDRGQLIQLFGNRFTPLPDGRADVEAPRARIHVDPGRRVIEIKADRGTIVAPDNQPRSGSLEGNVVVTVYDSHGRPQVDLSAASTDIELMLMLDEAAFDLDLGQVESDSAVRMEGKQAAFEGVGLHLLYNELRKRVDHLVIKQGRRLVLRQQVDLASPSNDASADAAQPQPAQAADDPDVQFYRAQFKGNVHVQSDSSTLDGDELELVFNLGRPGRSAAADPEAAAANDPASPTPAPALRDSLVLTWTGPLTISPVDPLPEQIADADDMLLHIAGRPVRMQTAEGDDLKAADVHFHRSSQQLRLVGSDLYPLAISSASMGMLQGREALIDQTAGVGYVLGPGSLRTHGQPTLLDRLEDPRSPRDQHKLPRGFSIAWAHRLDLNFYLQPPGQPAQGQFGRIRAIRDARFAGDVAVQHPDFTLRAQQLAAALDDPAQGAQSMRTLDAAGDVRVETMGNQSQPPTNLAAQQLHLDLARNDAGQTFPTRLQASGDIDARQPSRRLQAQKLDVQLEQVAATEPGRDADLRARTVTAQGDVRVLIEDRDLGITAEHLIADAAASQLDLFGSNLAPARIDRSDGTLTGGHIVVGSESQTVFVDGPGTFDFFSSPVDRPVTSAGGNDKPVAVNVSWNRTMRFDNRNSFAQFVGQVQSNAQSETDRSTLTCEDLRIDFVGTISDQTSNQPASSDQIKRGIQSIREVTARRDVVFVAESFADQLGGQLASRVRLGGPIMSFDGLMEQLQVLGAGTMLVEDYRPPTEPKQPPGGKPAVKIPSASEPKVTFAGRGITLFKWTGQMQLDARHNDMLLIDGVQMLHREPAQNKMTQLDCRRFLADLEPTGGLGAWMSDRAVQPQLLGAYADGQVRLLSGQNTVNTDHLEYTGFDQVLLLKADEGRTTEVYKEGEVSSLRAQRIRWDLTRDRIEIVNMGTTRAPVRR